MLLRRTEGAAFGVPLHPGRSGDYLNMVDGLSHPPPADDLPAPTFADVQFVLHHADPGLRHGVRDAAIRRALAVDAQQRPKRPPSPSAARARELFPLRRSGGVGDMPPAPAVPAKRRKKAARGRALAVPSTCALPALPALLADSAHDSHRRIAGTRGLGSTGSWPPTSGSAHGRTARSIAATASS